MDTDLTPPSFVSTFSIASFCVDGRAVVLGATLALGTCSLAACGDDADSGPPVPALAAATSPAEIDPPAPEPEPEPALDYDAEEGRVGTFSAGPGFTPDPLTHPGTTAPGVIDAHLDDERCHGWLAPQPDYVFTATRSFAELTMMVASREDTTLYVVDPDGELRCADDDEGADPIIRARFTPGVYRVWVGTRAQNVEAPYLLALSELEETSPSQLAH